MALTILLTGFGPFPGAPFNPTGALVRRLARLRRPALADVKLVPHVFQTSYRAVDRDLPRLLAELKPDATLMFGLSGRASCLHVETRARNAVSTLLRDAEGQFVPACIARNGPGALSLRAPVDRLALALRRVGIEAAISRDAGRYLCNYLCWRAVEAAAGPDGPKLVAFIHVPRVQHGAGRRGGRRAWRMPDLLRGGAAVLLTAVAATRQRGRMKER